MLSRLYCVSIHLLALKISSNNAANVTSDVEGTQGSYRGRDLNSTVAEKLWRIHENLHNSTELSCNKGFSSTRKDLLLNKWRLQTVDNIMPLISPFCVTTRELGNTLGDYLNDLACAFVSGIHFVAVKREFGHMSGQHANTSAFSLNSPLQFLPNVFTHPDPLSPAKVFNNKIT